MNGIHPFPNIEAKPALLSPLTALVELILAMPGSCVNIERYGERRRLRYFHANPEGGKGSRRALDLPKDDRLITALETIIHNHRNDKKTIQAAANSTAPDMRGQQTTLRKRLLAICPHGRVIRRRVMLVLDIALSLGPATVVDYLKHEPWLAKPYRMGRPRKKA